MQNSKYYHKLNQRLNQYGGIVDDLPPELLNLITCNLKSCKDIILFAGTNRKTYEAIKRNIINIVRYFKRVDRANIEVWNEFVDTRDYDQNYINFTKICKRLELVRLGIDVSLVNRDVDLTTEKLRIVRRLHVLGVHNSAIIFGINNSQNERILLNMIFLVETYNIRTPGHLIMISRRSPFALEFINFAINTHRITLQNTITFLINFNDYGISITNLFLNEGINSNATFNIIFSRFMNIETREQLQEQFTFIRRIILYKRMGFEDKLLLELSQVLNTPEKETRFRIIISQTIPGTNIRLSQNVALDIIENESNDITIETIHTLIRNGIGLEEEDQKYAFLLATNFSEHIEYFFELVRTFGFTNTYAYMSIHLFNEERESIDNIINYNRINGFTIEQAFTIERQFTQEMKDLITQLITANYTGDIIYGIMTDGDYGVDTEIDSDWENEQIEQITNNIEHINQLTGGEFGFNSIQAFQLMHTPIENITLLREHFNIENSVILREYEMDDIQFMVRLRTEFNFSEEYVVMALSNLSQEQIDIMIELKQNNIEDEYCYRVVTMENYNEEYRNIFLAQAIRFGSAYAFEFIETLARD